MKALSLYSGGCDGLSLAGSWCGVETIGLCEADEICRAVLGSHHPDTPIFDNDEDVTIDALRDRGIEPDDIDIIFGGPPCQCASVAGKRMGAADPRNRWPQFLRIVREVRPRWVMAENAPGLLSVDDGRLFGGILREMAEAGYAVGWQCYAASDVGAPHRRERVFIVGHMADTDMRRHIHGKYAVNAAEAGEQAQPEPTGCGKAGNVPYTKSTKRKGTIKHKNATRGTGLAINSAKNRNKRATQSRLGGDVDGISDWMDEATERLLAQKWSAGKGQWQHDWEPPRVAEDIPHRAPRIKMIGNSCPPQQYFVMLAAIVEMDKLLSAA